MKRPHRQQGVMLILASLALLMGIGALIAVELAGAGSRGQRDRVTERALAQAHEALVAYAADRPISSAVGPGYLPCPDLDNDGWAEATCGSLTGDSGQAQRLGRLPWKTLGLPDLRDGHGERLWYAVSSKHKGLLNCAASRSCVDMSPASALGTITLRDSTGAVLNDGTLSDPTLASQGGLAAIVIAPGAPLVRAPGEAGGLEQRRECEAADCDANGRCITEPPQRAATCNPLNYLDVAVGARFGNEDNASFVDRNDAAGRARNLNGFIRGPVLQADGTVIVNDRIAAVSYDDLMPRVLKRVALEVAHCLRYYASRPENASRLPWPAAACEQGPYFGAIPDTPFTATVASSAGQMLPRWWRAQPRVPEQLAELPTAPQACHIAEAPYDDGALRASPAGTPSQEGATSGGESWAWWTFWKPYVFYALASGAAPASGSAACASGNCIELVDSQGRRLAGDKHFAVLARRTRDCPSGSVSCDEQGCRQARVAASLDRAHAVVAMP